MDEEPLFQPQRIRIAGELLTQTGELGSRWWAVQRFHVSSGHSSSGERWLISGHIIPEAQAQNFQSVEKKNLKQEQKNLRRHSTDPDSTREEHEAVHAWKKQVGIASILGMEGRWFVLGNSLLVDVFTLKRFVTGRDLTNQRS